MLLRLARLLARLSPWHRSGEAAWCMAAVNLNNRTLGVHRPSLYWTQRTIPPPFRTGVDWRDFSSDVQIEVFFPCKCLNFSEVPPRKYTNNLVVNNFDLDNYCAALAGVICCLRGVTSFVLCVNQHGAFVHIVLSKLVPNFKLRAQLPTNRVSAQM